MNQPLRLKRYANGQAALPESNAQARVWVTEYVAGIDSLSARWNDGDHTRQRPADLLREFGEDDEAFRLRMVTWLHANPANPFATLATSDPEGHRQAFADHQAEAAPAVAQVSVCWRCDGEGWTEEGDPEMGSAPHDCSTCEGSGCIAAAPEAPSAAPTNGS